MYRSTPFPYCCQQKGKPLTVRMELAVRFGLWFRSITRNINQAQVGGTQDRWAVVKGPIHH